MPIRLGTRQSPLALWQAEFVASELKSRGHEVELVKITTTGDVTTTPLGQSGGQGLFTKEIQRALLDDRCDLAVHSLKDLPTESVQGLVLTAVPPREDPADCLISRHNVPLDKLPSNAKIGTGSPRRRAQLLFQRPDLDVQDIRGSVDSRLRKLDDGLYDAILLAFAGLHRLGLQSRISAKLSLDTMLPAVGQAALGLETRRDDAETIRAVAELNHLPSFIEVIAERALLRAMRAGCLAPLAAHAHVDNQSISLVAKVFSRDSVRCIQCAVVQSLPESLDASSGLNCAESVGAEGARRLIADGAESLIHDARDASGAAI